MDSRRLHDELLGAVRGAKLGVRLEPFSTPGSGGGLLQLRGKPWVVLDENSSLTERVWILAEVLASRGVDVSGCSEPARETVARARRRLERQRREATDRADAASSKNVRALPLPKPGLRTAKPREPTRR